MDNVIDLSADERQMLMMELRKVEKDRTTGFLLTLFLGGFGGHRYYLGQTGLGVVYTLFFWTLIPGMVAFVELFLIGGRIDRYNAEREREIADRIRLMRKD